MRFSQVGRRGGPISQTRARTATRAMMMMMAQHIFFLPCCDQRRSSEREGLLACVKIKKMFLKDK